MLDSPASLVLTALAAALVIVMIPRLVAAVRIAFGVRRQERARLAAREPDFDSARAYHERLPDAETRQALDDRTWRDLDLDDVFCRLDFTVSEPGRQHLYHLLRTPRFTAEPLARLDRAARRLSDRDGADERVRTPLRALRDPRAARLVDLCFDELPPRPRLWLLFPVLTTASVMCLALVPVWPRAAVWWVGVCLVNVLVQLAYKPRVKRFVPALHEVPALLRAAGQLARLDLDEFAPERAVLAEGVRSLRSLVRPTRWLMFEPGQAGGMMSDVSGSAYEYANMLFLLDVNAFVFTVEILRASRDRMRAMLEAIGYLDAAQSVATWRGTLSRWCVPEFTPPQKAMHVEGLVHPLVTDAVPNALEIDGASVLISGSNMAGKTTFVRALGVNAVLAQTLSTVCAASWQAPFLRVRSSIGRMDSVLEGKSYYLAEVESILALIRAKESGDQHLFLLDETFRGTNTTERVAAAYAVLRHLNRGRDLVVVATHDLEVLDLLDGAFAPHHFREQIAGEALTFDYLLQPGPSSTRNAIALLRFMRYPDAVVADATAHLDWQARRGPLPGRDREPG
ncbi:MAG TPA: hypothetical protein VNF92_02220 [Gemmatimonadaceae bacterium]|nr:hypothetical protein [Gemmatimonadaceae bacterium]